MIHQSRLARADINPTVNFLQILLWPMSNHHTTLPLALYSAHRAHTSDELLFLDPGVYSGQCWLTAVITTAIYQEEHDSPRQTALRMLMSCNLWRQLSIYDLPAQHFVLLQLTT